MQCLLITVGLAVHVACIGGQAIMQWRNSEKAMPLLALGFNHRAEAFYRCDSESGPNPNVLDAKSRGLRKVRVLHWATPEHITCKVVSLLNQFHEGSSENHFDIISEAGCLAIGFVVICCLLSDHWLIDRIVSVRASKN